MRDSLTIEVVGAPGAVATVTVVPGSANTVVIRLDAFGTLALVRPRAPGIAILRATSEGKTGQATITVH